MNEKVPINDNDEIEIDLLQLLRALKKKLWAMVLAAVILGGGAGGFSRYILTPQYVSTAMVYILSKETTLTSLADLQIGSQLTQDYKVIVTSRPVLGEVITSLGLGLLYEDLYNQITIDNPKDTRILTISVKDPDPQMAKVLADAIANTSSEYIGDIMEMVPPKIIEEGVVPIRQSSPNEVKYTVAGAALGILLVCGMTIMQVIMNDTVKTEEDVEKYLGLTVLASVPLRKGETAEDKDLATSYRFRARVGTDKVPRSRKKKSRRRIFR